MCLDFSKINQNKGDKPLKPLNRSTTPDIKFESKIINFFITNNKSKLILARQFIHMTKRELFEHCSLFVRNIDKDGNTTKNNFEVDENSYRFIYQTFHISNLYLVLVTKNTFNIFEALDIHKSIHRVISDLCSKVSISGNEEEKETMIISEIKSIAYDIILSIDDIVNNVSGKEEINLAKIKLNLKMESIDEKHFAIEKREKEDKARDNIVKGMEEIERLKRDHMYVDNSVSSEVIETKNYNRARNTSSGMNLKELLIQRLTQERQDQIRLSNFY